MSDLPILDQRHYSLLVALADVGTVNGAADRLGLTQSAASHRLREAERRLDLDLTERRGRRVVLTQAAWILVEAAKPALAGLAQAEREVQERAGGVRAIVRFGQSPYSRFHWLPAFLDIAEVEVPGVEIDLVARAAHDPLGALRDGWVDLVSLFGPKQATVDLSWIHQGRDPLVAVVAPGHALAGKSFVVPEDFVDERYITYESRPIRGLEWERFFGPAGTAPRRISRLQSPEAMLDLLRAGFGVSISSAWAVSPEVDEGTLVTIPLGEQGLLVDWWLVLPKAIRGGPVRAIARLLQRVSAEYGVGLNVQQFGEEPAEE